MGREANVFKDRKCQSCNTRMYATAQDLQKHRDVCRIAKRAGLVLPGAVERPKADIKLAWAKP